MIIALHINTTLIRGVTLANKQHITYSANYKKEN